jgi:hypothetical protein
LQARSTAKAARFPPLGLPRPPIPSKTPGLEEPSQIALRVRQKIRLSQKTSVVGKSPAPPTLEPHACRYPLPLLSAKRTQRAPDGVWPTKTACKINANRDVHDTQRIIKGKAGPLATRGEKKPRKSA